jgi:multidrug efflux pump subunit AcrA (membrane-fusion protein)
MDPKTALLDQLRIDRTKTPRQPGGGSRSRWLIQVEQLEAALAAAKLADDDARPTFLRNQRQLSEGLISPETFDVDVSENFINRVHSKRPATITLNAYPQWQIPAEVIAIIPTADRAKATVKVRIGFKQKDARIVPDMGARVAFLDDAREARAGAASPTPGVVVPPEAVQANSDTGTVFVINGHMVERRAVRLGARNAGGQTVLSGLAAGTNLAVGNFSKLADGQRIRIVQ